MGESSHRIGTPPVTQNSMGGSPNPSKQEGYNKIMQEFKIREEEDIIVIEDFEKKITLLSDDKVEEDE